MRFRRAAAPSVVFGILFLALSCNDEHTTQPQAGLISVQVVDISSNQPLADVEITIVQTNLVAKTDASGTAVFEVGVGDYFVDARVCCIGPWFIEHHVAVVVVAGKTIQVRLHACTACL